ncbi:MAG: trigger factor [Elusimicrobiota bacterium]
MENLDYNIEKKPKCIVELDISIPWEELEEKLENMYRDIKKNVKMPGFRKGKVPMDTIKNQYQQQAKGQLVREVVPEILDNIFKKEDIIPVTTPQIKDYNFKENEALTLGVSVETSPDVKLKKYKKLKLVKKIRPIEDEEIKNTIQNLRDRNASLKVKEGSVKEGDYVVVEYNTFMNGNSIDPGVPEERIVIAGNDEVMPGFGKELKGLEKGDEKKVSYRFPEKYRKKELQGRKADFEVKVKEIKEKKLPSVQEIAENLDFKDESELKENIRESLENQIEQSAQNELEEQIIDEMLDKHDFEVPDGMVQESFEKNRKQMENYMKRQGGDPSMIEDEKIQKQSEREVKAGLLLSKVAEEEDIKVTPEDREEEKDNLRKMYGENAPDNLDKYVNDNKILTGKVFDFLKDKAKIKEKKVKKKK